MMNSIEAAKYIIAFSDTKGDLITNKKLQKLLYYVQAWHLVYFEGDPLFEEQPQAWVHGPVYPSVYDYFRSAGYHPVSIEDEYQETGVSCDEYLRQQADGLGLDARQQNMIAAVMLKYSRLSAFDLEMLSHSERPWLEKREGLSDVDRCQTSISFDTMRSYYSGLIPQHA